MRGKLGARACSHGAQHLLAARVAGGSRRGIVFLAALVLVGRLVYAVDNAGDTGHFRDAFDNFLRRW